MWGVTLRRRRFPLELVGRVVEGVVQFEHLGLRIAFGVLRPKPPLRGRRRGNYLKIRNTRTVATAPANSPRRPDSADPSRRSL